MKKIEINQKLYNVMSKDEFLQNIDLYNYRNTAILCDGDDIVYPVRNPSMDSDPGIYCHDGSLDVISIMPPSENDRQEYSASKIIDFDNARDIGEIINNNNMLKDIQSDLMVNNSSDGSIFYLNISDQDTPEMRAVKEAINAKRVDKHSYEERFTQFQNDMRLLRGNSITLNKMISICNNFDIACTLTLSDKEGAINPMETAIEVELTSNRPNRKGAVDND